MQKLALTVALFSILVAVPDANAITNESEMVVIENSPFGETSFKLHNDYLGESSWGGLDTAVEFGRREADAVDTYLPTPNSILIVAFKEITKDAKLLKRESWEWIGVPVKDLRIIVDMNAQGMSISYERKTNELLMKNAVLTVPSPIDHELWKTQAELHYAVYLSAFWRKRYDMMEAVRKSNTKAATLQNMLPHDPITIFPKP